MRLQMMVILKEKTVMAVAQLSFMSKFSDEQREIFETYIKERDPHLEELLVTDTVTGKINSTCNGRGRPIFKNGTGLNQRQ